jgi:hypothetical protein
MHPDQLLGGLPIFYVDFVYNSIHYRIAQNAMDAKQDGTIYQYTDGLLQFDFVEAANVGGDVETNTVGCQLAIPGIDVIELANMGLGLDGLQCEFGYYIWRNGEIVQSYNNRIVLYRGEIQQPQFGDPDEPNNFVAFTIEAQPWAQNQLLLNTPVIDQRFADRHIDTADGKAWPIVFGQPGFAQSGQYTKNLYATPAYCIKEYDSHNAQFMVAGHDIVGTGTVTIIDDNGQTTVKTPVRALDTFGNIYHYITILPSDNVAMPGYSGSGDSKKWWVYWDTPTYPNRFGAGSLTRGGDVLQWAMLRSGQRVDIGAFANMAALLNRYQFSGYINDPAMYAWEWIQGNILPLLPVGIRMGPNGLRPVLDQLGFIDLLQATAQWHIGKDLEIQQTTAVTQTTATDDIVNDATIKYAFNGYGQNLTSVARCRHIRQGQNELQTDIAKTSVNRYGVKQTVLESNYIYDGITADLVVQTVVKSNALPRFEVTVIANMQWGYLQIGDIIEVTATRLGLKEHHAMVVGKRWAQTVWEFTIQYQINPNLA